MTSPLDLLLTGAHVAGLELVSSAGGLHVAADGRLEPLAGTTPLERELAQALALALRPWRCPWCGGPAELPDGCSQCMLALGFYSRAGARFPQGASVAHAFRDLAHAVCGLDLVTLPDRPPYRRAELPEGALCRRCLWGLIREYEASTLPPPEARHG